LIKQWQLYYRPENPDGGKGRESERLIERGRKKGSRQTERAAG